MCGQSDFGDRTSVRLIRVGLNEDDMGDRDKEMSARNAGEIRGQLVISRSKAWPMAQLAQLIYWSRSDHVELRSAGVQLSMGVTRWPAWWEPLCCGACSEAGPAFPARKRI